MVLLGGSGSGLIPRLPTPVRWGTRPVGGFGLAAWPVPSRGDQSYGGRVVSVEDSVRLQVDPWVEMRKVITGPLPDIAARFSRFLGPLWSHDALVIFTRECTGRPRKVAGNREIVDRVTIDELDEIKQSIEPGGVFAGIRSLGGGRRRVWAVRDAGDTLLVLVPRPSQAGAPDPDEVAAMFGIVATSIQHQVAQASPDYLAESRAASRDRKSVV